jgi:hypothetical protein
MDEEEMKEEYNLNDIQEEMNEDNLCQSGSIDLAEIEKDLQEWEATLEKEKPSVEDLVAIPEASPAQASVRRGKHRANDDDVEMATKAECLKALNNEGNESAPLLMIMPFYLT